MIHIIHLIIFRFGELSCVFKTVENVECVHCTYFFSTNYSAQSTAFFQVTSRLLKS